MRSLVNTTMWTPESWEDYEKLSRFVTISTCHIRRKPISIKSYRESTCKANPRAPEVWPIRLQRAQTLPNQTQLRPKRQKVKNIVQSPLIRRIYGNPYIRLGLNSQRHFSLTKQVRNFCSKAKNNNKTETHLGGGGGRGGLRGGLKATYNLKLSSLHAKET